ncbi:MAG: hypothetical protein ABWZ29_00795 [Casimicrobiaceae bacterium]
MLVMVRIAVLPATQGRSNRRADSGAYGHGEQQMPVFFDSHGRLTLRSFNARGNTAPMSKD